jgi:hypothetical protein
MEKLVILGFLIAATAMEASGDAIVRMGLNQQATELRTLLFFGWGSAAFRVWLNTRPRSD